MQEESKASLNLLVYKKSFHSLSVLLLESSVVEPYAKG